ncbi:hypothetical protein CFN78_01190 [Amycolatopsis antarctica]|uniref:PPE domain-containing protein n=1 Tax=Amycolatopsis antarctica TaxID=1854586 RepID=A0A263DA39_9PSEU|nr:PPE domain-containing protein [Amycolatopsis antarctica]OZM74858.1 hypothetical protein CFN78_01190 [Amycolatopsis antarctica]
MALGANEIAALLQGGPGPESLFTSQDAANSLSLQHEQVARSMASLQNAMTSSWQGVASQQAFAGAGPLVQASDVSAGHLSNAQTLLSGQGNSFNEAKNAIGTGPGPKPESTFASDNLPFLTSRNEEIDAWNAQAQEVVDRYNTYSDQSTHNASNWPTDYGQLGLPPGGVDFAVKPPVGDGPVVTPGDGPTVNGEDGTGATRASSVSTGGPVSQAPTFNGPGAVGNPQSPSPGGTPPPSGTPFPGVNGPGTGTTKPSEAHPGRPGVPPGVGGYTPPRGRPRGGNTPDTVAGYGAHGRDGSLANGSANGTGNGSGPRAGAGSSAGYRVGAGGPGSVPGGPGSGSGSGGQGGPGAGSGSGANSGLGAGKGTGAGMPGQGGMTPGSAAGPGAAGRGAGGMGGMAPGAGRANREEDAEHKRLEVLQEPDPDAIFGPDPGQKTTPPVIGG